MNLIIRKEVTPTFDADNYYLDTGMLLMKSTHLFIASYKWDRIEIELDEKIPQGALRFFHMVCDDIKVILPDFLVDAHVRELAELYPERAGKIRMTYLTKHNMGEVLQGCTL